MQKKISPRLFTPIRKSGFIPGKIFNTLLEFCSSMNNRGSFLLIIFFTAVFCKNLVADTIQPSDFKDKFIVYKNILEIKEEAQKGQEIKVNNALVKEKNNSFSYEIILSPGKNLIKIKNIGSFRVLRMVSFPDSINIYTKRPSWAKEESDTLNTLGIIEGHPDGNYYFNDSTTKGEFATWLCKAQNLKIQELTNDPFKDVPKEHWRAPYIEAVIKAGYMKGYSDDNFNLDYNISRVEAAVSALKSEEPSIKEVVSIGFFRDVPKTHPLFNQLQLAKSLGLIKGVSYEIPMFEPYRDITHAETAALLSRLKGVKTQKNELYDFSSGYTDDKLCKINIAPEISSVEIIPKFITINTDYLLTINAKIDPAYNLDDILYVKADLSDFGNEADAKMYDDATNGDKVKGDGEYTLKFQGSSEGTGEKNIKITAVNRFGWKGDKGIKVLATE